MNTLQRWGAGLFRLRADELSPQADRPTSLNDLLASAMKNAPSATATLAINWVATQATGRIVSEQLPDDHPILVGLNTPTTDRNVSGRSFWRAAFRYLLEQGNVFIRVVPAEDGELMTLRLVPASQFDDESGEPLPIPDDVLHIRIGVDLAKPERGVSPLTLLGNTLKRDQLLDMSALKVEQIAQSKVGLFVPAGDRVFSPQEVAAIEKDFESDGVPVAVTDTPGDFHMLAPRHPDYEVLADQIQSRICAAFGIHPTSINLAPPGSLTYSNVTEFRRQSFQDGVIPVQEEVAAALERLLPPELGQVRLVFDNSRKAYAQPPESEEPDEVPA